MPDGNLHAPPAQHSVKFRKALRLLFRPAQIRAVGSGEVAEQALGEQARQAGDPGADIRVFLIYLKADAAHAGIHGEVEPGGQLQKLGGFGQGESVFHAVNRRADALPDGGGERVRRRVAQNQNGGGQSRLPQLHGLQNRTDAEKGAFVLQKPRNLYRTVTVGVGLNHRHNGYTGLFPDGIHIGSNGIQIDFYSRAVKIHRNQLTFSGL